MPQTSYTFERIYLCSIEQSNCLQAIAEKGCKQKNIAGCYADCIRAEGIARQRGDVSRIDWPLINNAIMARWPKGLKRVKEMAWKELEEGVG